MFHRIYTIVKLQTKVFNLIKEDIITINAFFDAPILCEKYSLLKFLCTPNCTLHICVNCMFSFALNFAHLQIVCCILHWKFLLFHFSCFYASKSIVIYWNFVVYRDSYFRNPLKITNFRNTAHQLYRLLSAKHFKIHLILNLSFIIWTITL